jgi:transitional endoplasmic reticulum ATPase
MPLRTAIAALERKAKDEETLLDVHEVIDAYPEDAIVALNIAMRRKYGWASPTPKMTWFGPVQPDLITVKTGPKPGDQVQVPFGQFTLPGVENPIETHRFPGGPNGWCLIITGQVRKREAAVVKELANLARDILKTDSIYKGKAIRLKSDTNGNLNLNQPPEFIDTDAIKPDELVLNADALSVVESALWAPIRHTEACIRNKIPLKRGILLEGPYGTGKTMTAAVTSRVCVETGWTYILLDDVRSLKDALLFAQRYAPAVVFAEDIDRVVATRDQQGNDILNTIDGVLSKNSQVITVLTTNHVDKLDRAMLRPGRLDAVISVKAPDAEAVQRLIRIYGRSLIDKKEGLEVVGQQLAGNIPATIREVVERSKLGMIANGREKVTEDDLVVAATGMEYHLKLLADKPDEPSDEHKVGASLVRLLRDPVATAIENEGEATRVCISDHC